MTKELKRELKARAQLLEPVMKLGKNGVTDSFVLNLDAALTYHKGLLKVRFVANKEQKHELAAQLAERTRSELVTMVGNVAVLYRAMPVPPKV